uniref:Small ribosomal subunit protein uS2c n=1 Tax=Cyanidium sp. THAL103 TaxID=3027999 RepID=A0A9Y1I409_9RHOD|nr:ribosomal protein S2 [Cyanidium sp. THAL103]
MSIVTLSELLEAGVHFGHQAKRWNPKIFPYLYTERNGIHIIDLVQTAKLLTHACEFLQSEIKLKKRVLFIGTKKQASSVIENEAKRCGEFYINDRWLGGLLTNWSTVQLRIQRLHFLEKQELEGSIESIPKKEASILRRELFKLRKHLNGIKNMEKIPDIAIIVDPKKENTAILECKKLEITTIGILDTNCDPNFVDIPIPANDDAIRSVQLMLSKLSTAIIESK